MTELNKIRVCDLKIGDVVIIHGLERRVYRVNGVVYLATTGPYGDHYDKVKIGSKSQQWVELVRRGLPEENTYTR
jgi:hypothetical protein